MSKEAEEQAMKDEKLAAERLEGAKKLSGRKVKYAKFLEIVSRFPKTKAGEEARDWLEMNRKYG